VFYTISLALVGAVFSCILLIYSLLWLAILSGAITVLLVIVTLITQAYQQYVKQNKYRFQALAGMGQRTPGLIDYCRDNVKLWWQGGHPTCHDCKKSIKRSQAVWLYAPIGHWNEALQEVECSKMWLCLACTERRLCETVNQVHLASESSQHWKTIAEQLQAQVGNLESELVAKHSEGSHN
jgi:hypothetical protein